MSYLQQVPLGQLGSVAGLAALWVASAAWLLAGGAFAGYVLLVSTAAGALLLLAMLLTWHLVLRQGLRWLAGTRSRASYENKRWLKSVHLGFVLTQLLIAVWTVHQLFG